MFEPLKYKKNEQIWTKKFPNINDYEKPRKKEERKKGNLPKPLPSFSFLRPLFLYYPQPYTQKKIIKMNLSL